MISLLIFKLLLYDVLNNFSKSISKNIFSNLKKN